MNREDIDRLAQEAGISTGFSVHIPKWDKPTWLFMRRFAALVAAHTLANIDPSKFMSYQEGLEAGRLAEREACAKVCDELAARDKLSNYYGVAANAIRARRQQ